MKTKKTTCPFFQQFILICRIGFIALFFNKTPG